MQSTSSQNAILARIDSISRELEDLRRLVLKTSSVPKASNLTDQLLGVLGTESITAYDYDVDWKRFELQ